MTREIRASRGDMRFLVELLLSTAMDFIGESLILLVVVDGGAEIERGDTTSIFGILFG